jgi:CheY-like chemotaxis protein
MNELRKKILIVDDDDDFAAALSSFLEAHGYGVVRARNGRQGLSLAKVEQPDLILMDIVMTERTEGFFAVQEIRHTKELKDLPVFVLTSIYSHEPEFQIAPEKGWLAHDEFFSKPVDLTLLIEKIRQRIGGSREEANESAPERTKP